MGVSDDILDALTAHEIGLQRLSNATVRKMLATLNMSDVRIVERLLQEDISALSRKRQEALLSDIRRIVKSAYADATGQLHIELEALAEYEGQYQLDMFRAVVPVKLDTVSPSPSQLWAAVNSRPFQGRLLKDWYADLEAGAFQRLRNAIRAGIVEGRTIDQMVREVRGSAAQGYQDGILQVNRRAAESTVRTAVAHTANAARAKLYESNSGLIKGAQWVSTLDGRTSAVCRARDGIVYPVDSGPRPPAHPNCLPGHSIVSPAGSITGASKRWFKGEMVTIRTHNGREVSATPNHPILTVGGWKRIGLIDVTDKLVCVIRPKGAAALNADNDHVEASIQDITEAFFRSVDVTTMPVPTTAPDFHGDGAGSEVAIIGANRSLHIQDDASFGNHGVNAAFNVGDMGLRPLLSFGPLAKVINASFHTSDGIMSRTGDFSALDRAATIHSSLLLSGCTPDGDAMLNQDALDGTWADAEFLRDSSDTDAGSISVDDVVTVERGDFSGHVFNLETKKHVYYSMDIVIHNCRSSTVPVLKSLREMGIDRDMPASTRASMNGQVADSTTYDSWLRKQPREFQDEVLGSSKADLFRSGLTLDRYVTRAGKEYTLDQLKKREADTWSKAFQS